MEAAREIEVVEERLDAVERQGHNLALAGLALLGFVGAAVLVWRARRRRSTVVSISAHRRRRRLRPVSGTGRTTGDGAPSARRKIPARRRTR